MTHALMGLRFGMVALALIAGAVSAEEQAPAPAASVQTAVAIERSMNETVSAESRVEADPTTERRIATPRPGTVAAVLVRVGEQVAEGTPLYRFETAPAASTQYSQASAAASYAERQLEHIRRLYAEQMATRDQLAAAERDLADARSQLARERELGDHLPTELVGAPFAGVVTQVVAGPGERVAADAPILVLARRAALVVPLGLEAEDAIRVPKGAAVSLNGIKAEAIRFTGMVSAIGAAINPATGLVDATVQLSAEDSARLMIGLPVRATITLGQIRSVVVPRAALGKDDEGLHVFVVANGRALRRPVIAGASAAGWVAVRGVKPGERVVIAGNAGLINGMAVHERTP